VSSIGDGVMVIGGSQYAIDGASAAVKQRNHRWVDAGSLSASVRPGATVEALCITNEQTGMSTVALAWV
jgi:hypothetical protein